MNKKQARKGRKVIYAQADGLVVVGTIMRALQRHATVQFGAPSHNTRTVPLEHLVPLGSKRTRRSR
jgi:hypothetical protein